MKRVFGSTSKKVLLSLGALGVAAGIASLGTFATFTSTTSASQTVSSGTVTIALGATGAATNRLTVNASGLVPGDTVQRSFDLTNSGSQNLASIGLTTTASPTSLLDSDGTNGLQMVVDKCSIAWVEVGTSPAFTYTCAGTTTTVIASRAVIGSGLNMASLAALTSGGTDHLRVTLTLPSTTGNTFQGLSSTVTYSFLGTQRTATNQ
ncbi:MAG: spore coat-associated protein [Acidimicrobiaceae bacterium]|jgi:spore coat-associated protein N